jgi:hypothetical protein
MTLQEILEDFYVRQLRRARRYESFALYRAAKENDVLLEDFLSMMKDGYGERYVRADAFSRFMRIEAYAYEEAHPGTVWKTFSLHGHELVSYTLEGEGAYEEKATIEHLAYENSCQTREIKTGYR